MSCQYMILTVVILRMIDCRDTVQLIQDERAAVIQSEGRNITLLLWRSRVD